MNTAAGGKDLEKYTDRLKCELEDGEDELMMFYGVGNHGGGPTKENIRSIHELNGREDMPVMEMETTENFFRQVKNNGKEYPEFIGGSAASCQRLLQRAFPREEGKPQGGG